MTKMKMIGLTAAVLMAVSPMSAFAAAKTSTLSGKLTSMSGYMMNVKIGKTTYAVTTSLTTKYLNKKAKSIASSAIKVNDRVWVWGVKSTKNHTMTGVTKVEDITR